MKWNLNNWTKVFLNKYFIVGLFFIIWMTFFDQNSYMLHREIDNDIKDLQEEKAYFENEINREKTQLKKLKENDFEYEKLAREKYLMKRENEDIFVIERKDSTTHE